MDASLSNTTGEKAFAIFFTTIVKCIDEHFLSSAGYRAKV